jgi:hypothetical protein
MADLPISAQQAEQLTRAVASASAAYRNGKKLEMGGIDWEAVDTQAQTILSAEQMALMTRADLPGAGASRWSGRVMPAILHATGAERLMPAPPTVPRRIP